MRQRRARRSACPTRARPLRRARTTTRATSTAAARTARRDAIADVDGGRDGRLRRASAPRPSGTARDPNDPACRAHRRPTDVMGYHDARGDPELLGLRAATSCCRTTCSSRSTRGACPRTCTWSRAGRRSCPTPRRPARAASPTRRSPADRRIGQTRPPDPDYAWTDLTYLLHQAGVSAGATTCTRARSRTARTTTR